MGPQGLKGSDGTPGYDGHPGAKGEPGQTGPSGRCTDSPIMLTDITSPSQKNWRKVLEISAKLKWLSFIGSLMLTDLFFIPQILFSAGPRGHPGPSGPDGISWLEGNLLHNVLIHICVPSLYTANFGLPVLSLSASFPQVSPQSSTYSLSLSLCLHTSSPRV